MSRSTAHAWVWYRVQVSALSYRRVYCSGTYIRSDHAYVYKHAYMPRIMHHGAFIILQHIGHESVTGRQFHERVTAVVNLLKWKGVVPDDHVLVTIQPSIDFYAVAVGVFAVGGSLIIIDPSMGLERANHCVATAKPSVWLWVKGSKFKLLKVMIMYNAIIDDC